MVPDIGPPQPGRQGPCWSCLGLGAALADTAGLGCPSFVVPGHYLTGIRPASSVPFSVFRRFEEEGPSSEAETLSCVHFAKVLETKDLILGAYVNCGKFCVHSA
jgi:hypothetical protein